MDTRARSVAIFWPQIQFNFPSVFPIFLDCLLSFRLYPRHSNVQDSLNAKSCLWILSHACLHISLSLVVHGNVLFFSDNGISKLHIQLMSLFHFWEEKPPSFAMFF